METISNSEKFIREQHENRINTLRGMIKYAEAMEKEATECGELSAAKEYRVCIPDYKSEIESLTNILNSAL